MKFAYSTRIFRLRPLAEAIRHIADAGFCAIELLADRPHAFPEDLNGSSVTELNKCMSERKITISNLNSCVAMALGDAYHPSWIEEDWLEREKRIRYTLDCLRLAAAMGIPSVTTGAGGVIPESMNQGEAWRLFLSNMHRVSPLARKLGVKLLLQPEPEMLLRTSEDLLRFVEDLDYGDTIGINFNVAHLFCAGEDPCEAWERVKNYVAHIHLGDVPESRRHQHVQLGEGGVDIPRFLEYVGRSGYDGFVTVEMESHEREANGMVDTSAEYLRKIGFLPAKDEGC